MTALFLLIFLVSSRVEWVSPTSLDLGEISYNQPQIIRFEFRNISPEPLTIDNVRPGCGCTAADWSDLATPPGQVGVIELEYDAVSTGYFSQTIKVYFTGQRKAEKLYLEGTVIDKAP